MAQDKFKRQQTTILNADVAGYSRIMQDDEAATVKTFEAHKRGSLKPHPEAGGFAD